MRLEEAIALSKVNAAYRSYYPRRPGIEPLRDKYIVVQGFLYEQVYTVWADTFNYIAPLHPSEMYKLRGIEDWEPVAPPGWKNIDAVVMTYRRISKK